MYSKKNHFNDNNILWSKATKIEEFDFSKSKILKGETIPIFKEIFKTNIQDKLYKAYEPWGNVSRFESYTELRFEAIIGMEVDTFVAFDPETFKETITVSIQEPVDFNANLLTSFVHYWYWDENSNTLSCELVSLAIMYEGLDEDENSLYFLDMFKIKANNNTN